MPAQARRKRPAGKRVDVVALDPEGAPVAEAGREPASAEATPAGASFRAAMAPG